MTRSGKWRIGFKYAGFIVLGLMIVTILINLRVICSTIRFFTMIEKIPIPAIPHDPAEDFSVLESKQGFLEELKQVARFVLVLPEQDRRQIISIYSQYINLDANFPQYYERVFKLFLLQRLLFAVPESYPISDACVVLHWDKDTDARVGDSYNMLWPLGYDEEGHLTLKTMMGDFLTYYDGIAEYNCLAYNFPFRSIDKLE